MHSIYRRYCGLILLCALFAVSSSGADLPKNAAKDEIDISALFGPHRKEYILSRKQYYMDFFGEDEDYNIDPARLEKNLIDYLSTNLNYEKIKNRPPGNQRFKDQMEIAALCYAAAEIQCATPIVMYPSMFRFSIYIERYFCSRKIDERLEDYPFMHLAVQCGRKSIPALKRLIFDPKIHENRLMAIAILMKIDTQEARKAALNIKDELSPEMQSILLSYLENPWVEPWNIFAMFSSRGRIMMEHARKGSRR